MKLRFTKMHGAGNDVVLLDATRVPIRLSAAQYRHLADRRFGIGADQILLVEPGSSADIDFGYRIFNGGSGEEVEHCGNGARCFARFVADHGLSHKTTLRVQTLNNQIELRLRPDGQVTVDMGRPIFDAAQVPFDVAGLVPHEVGGAACWPISMGGEQVVLSVLSMGNPHAVQVVADVDIAPVERLGPLIEAHQRFPRRVNAGFMQIVSRDRIRLRVWERGAGETLACGTGACAAVVAGIRLGLLDPVVEVEARGGTLGIEWPAAHEPVLMTGPAETVFDGEIEL